MKCLLGDFPLAVALRQRQRSNLEKDGPSSVRDSRGRRVLTMDARIATHVRRRTNYLGWPRRRLHSPRVERMKVKPPSPPSAQSVQTKKKPAVDLAISP